MVQLLTCPHGHQWQPPPDTPGRPPEQALICPVCGASAADSTLGLPSAATRTLDELPPRPQSLPEPQAGPVAVPGYEILGELGRGGMGVVYQARQISLNRVVALKMIRAGLDAEAEELARFRAEAEAVARLRHPHIVHVYDIGSHEGRLFFSLEFVDGESLAQRLRRQPLAPREAAELAEALARAVHHAHQQGIVHRDLKPGNVLLTAAGIPKITDFGLAKRLDQPAGQTRTGAVLGTPSYMAPEQARGQSHRIGPATDVYGLGAILYELLTGRPPFRAETAWDTAAQVITQEPVPPRQVRPEVPQPLEAICLKCLRKEPAERYPSAEALAGDLHGFLSAPAAVRPSLPPPRDRRRRLSVVIGGIGIAALLCLLAVAVIFHRSPAPPGKSGWEILPPVGPADEVFSRIAFPTRTAGFVAGRRGVYRTTDGGRSWQQTYTAPAPQRVHFLRFQDERTGWLGTDQLVQTTDGGTTWEQVPLPEPVRAVRALASGDGWLLAGSTAGQPDGDLVLFRKRGATVPWEKLDPVAAGYWGGAGEPHRRWLLGDVVIRGPGEALAALFDAYEERGVLLRTTDGGDTWAPVMAVENDVYRIGFLDGRHGWLAGSRGSLWRTADGGKTWAPQPNPGDVTPSCLEFAPQGKGFGLAPLWQGKVLLTTTGDDWRAELVDVGYSTPDAAVVDAGCAYLLGSEGCIAHYLDPGASAGR